VKVKPEDLKIANKVANIKETTSSAAKKNYWNGVHRLKNTATTLMLMTTDGQLWLEWHIPVEDTPIEMDVLVQNEGFDYAARYLEGGSLEVQRSGGIVTLHKGQLNYRLREETRQKYILPKAGKDPVVWETDSDSLAKALKFVARFIDETNPQENKNCATMYKEEKMLTGGNPRRIATVRGLTIEADMSFKTRGANAVAEFLSAIGDRVRITATDANYIFEDPTNKHKLTILAEGGRFLKIVQDLSARLMEKDRIDRKMLLTRAKAFAGAMPQGSDRLNLSFRGAEGQASLRLHTPGEIENEITDDEFGIVREIPEEIPQPPRFTEKVKYDVANPPDVDLAVSREFLANTLDQMDGTVISWSYCGRMVLIEDEDIPEEDEPIETESTEEGLVAEGEEQEAVAVPAEPATPIMKSVLLSVQTVKEASEAEAEAKKAEEAAEAKAKEEADKKAAATKEEKKEEPKEEAAAAS